jgi:nicotinamidase-related amidase
MWPENASDWLKTIKPYNCHVMKLRKTKACLLVIDMQNEFLEDDGAIFFHYGAEIVPNVKRLIAACREASIPVVFTGHVHEDPAVDGGMTAEWWPLIKEGRCLIKGSRGAEIYSGLRPRRTDKVIWKHRYSAFYNTDLEIILRGMGVTDLIITGVLTNVCCESTARDAFFHDFRVFFLADATASSEPEFHIATLRNVAYAFAYVVTADQMVKQIRG